MAGDKEVEYSKGKEQGFKSKAHGFASFIWNGETGEFLGRTGKSWALIGIYYLIFYCCLAGFFAANLMVFFMGISDTEPKLQNYDTLLKGHPGMGFRPMPNDDNTLIFFKKGESASENYKKIIANLDTFLEPYSEKNQNASFYQDCEGNTTASDGKVCRFPLDKLGSSCSKANDYGYKSGNPCVLLKLNKIFKWEPKQWTNDTDVCSKEPCPRHAIAPQYVGVTCEGESDADKDYIKDMQFYPKQGFGANYYPYTNQKGYLAPLVAVQFKVQPGTVVMVWCKAWADNIYRHKNDRAGSVHFELQVD